MNTSKTLMLKGKVPFGLSSPPRARAIKRRGNSYFLVARIGAALVSTQLAASEPSPKPVCHTKPLVQALLTGALDRALLLTEHCIDVKKADLDRIEKEYGGKPSGFVDVVGLAESTTGVFFVAKAEILTLKGDFRKAEAALAAATKFDQTYSKAGLGWSLGGAPLPIAKAFFVEKTGDLNGAKIAYEAVVAEAKKGWDVSTVLYGRLALIALQQGDDAGVERWTKEASASDPGAKTAYAALLQKRGDTKTAKEYYAAALKLMNEAAESANWSLPIYFAEYKRVTDWLRP